MRFDKKFVAGGILAAGLVAAGASAYTATIGGTVTAPVAGYISVNSTGATAVSVNYTYSTADPPVLTGITFVASGDTSLDGLYIGFDGTGTMSVCSGTGAYVSPNTTYTCTGLNESTSVLTSVDLAVHN